MHRTKFSFAVFLLGMLVSCQPNSVDTKPARRFLSESSSTADDIWKKHSTYTVSYTEDGSLAKSQETQSDTSSVATVNTSGTTVYEYNAKGLLEKATKSSLTKTTNTSSFSFTSSVTEQGLYSYEYDTSDRLVKSSSQVTNSGDTRSIREIRTYSYDAQGKLLSCDVVKRYNLIENKANFVFQDGVLVKYAESVPNSSTEYAINSMGLLTKISTGTFIASQRTYDATKNLVKEESQFTGTTPSTMYTYWYDKSPVPRSTLPKFKGHPDDVVEKLFNPSSNNVVKETILDNKLGSPVTSEITYNVSYDSDGLLTSKSWVNPTNKAYYRKYIYTYQ
jgi:hypothetical protein